MKRFLKLSLLLSFILLLSACSGAKKIGTAKDGNEFSIEKAAIKLVKASEVGEYELINAEQLKTMIDSGEDMLIIDTMPASFHAKKSIPNALNAEIPVKLEDVTEEQKAKLLEVLGSNKDKKIVFYCGFVACERSHVAALIAKEEGFTNLVRQAGGIIAWEDAGYKVEAGK